jgi:hypothetical protein
MMLKHDYVKEKNNYCFIDYYISFNCGCFWHVFYFFQTSVKINSEFGVDGISIVDESGKVIHKDSSHFSHFSSYGNASIYRELLHSGCCTKMDGCIENGKKAYRVLLWIEPDCASVHQVS